MKNVTAHSITFPPKCEEILNRLENAETRKECVKEILGTEFDSKMSEQDYVYYKFLRGLGHVYKEGFDEGMASAQEDVDNQPNQLTIGTFLNRKISARKNISDNFIKKMAPILRSIRNSGAQSNQEIAQKLTELGVKTMAGNYMWYTATVRDLEAKVSKRIEELEGLKRNIEEQIELLN